MTVKKTDRSSAGKQGKEEHRFSKEQLLAAERFQNRRDMIQALLSEKEQYTLRDVEKMMERYRKGLVK